MIKKIVNACRSSYYWVKALQSASRSEYIESLAYLASAEKLVGRRLEFCALRGSVEAMNANYSEGIRNSSLAVTMLDKSKKLNDDEKKYMKYFLQTVMLKCSKKLSFENTQLEAELNKEPNIDLRNVHKRFFMNFPIKIE